MMQVMMMSSALYLGDAFFMEEHIQNFIRWTSFIVATPVVFYAARPFFIAARRDLRTRHLSMDVPVSIAIGGAYIASVWATITQSGEVYYDSVSMFTFFLLIGRFFEMKARHRTGMAGNELANILPASATRLTDTGEQLVPVSELNPGDRVLVKPGHSIPADGILFTQHTSIDESALTGEPLPVSKGLGDHLVGGTINMEQAIEMEITSSAERSRMSSILNLLDRAQADKPKVAKIADKVASYFVAAVLITAIVVSLIWWQISPEDAFWVTLSVLVVTCPCALSLATPTALTAAIGSLRKMGILVTRGHVLESLAQCTAVYFDKTGTLTTGKLTLNKTTSLCEQSTEELNQLAAAIESRSEHPIASAFNPYFAYSVDEATNHVGKGVEGTIKERKYRIGKPQFVAELYNNDPPAYPSNIIPRRLSAVGAPPTRSTSAAAAAVGVEESKVFGRLPQAVADNNLLQLLDIKSLAFFSQTSKISNNDAINNANTQLQRLNEEYKQLIEECNKDPKIAGIQIPVGSFKNSIHELRVLTDCKNNLPNAIRVLRDNRITDIKAQSRNGETPLHTAVERGSTEIVRDLIAAGAEVNAKSGWGDTPLHLAALKGHTEAAQALIAAGADVNARDENGDSPLHWAACEGHSEIAQALINAGADVNAQSRNGETPLHWAACEGHSEIAQALINAGADVNAQSRNGETPLHWAALHGHTEIAEDLIDAGATWRSACNCTIM